MTDHCARCRNDDHFKMFMYYWILNKLIDNFCNNYIWRHHVNICSFNEINVYKNEFESSSRQYITLFTSKKRINNKNNFKTFINMFNYLSTRRVEFKLIIILLTMFTFNVTSSTFAIKQSNVLFIFFDNMKNA